MQALRTPNSLENTLQDRLKKRRELGSFRKLGSAAAAVDFTSNDYLGLARSVELANRIEHKLKCAQPRSPRNGSTGSRLLSGNSPWAEVLEGKIAAFHGTESALLFNSGYDANLGALSALLREGDTVFYDELCHASIHDGIRLGKASAYPFKHNDTEQLEEWLSRLNRPTTALKRSPTASVAWIVVESVYSMNGDTSALPDLASLAQRFESHLFVDEAHATGVFGPAGAGIVQGLGLASEVAVRVHTFGKALGCHGAVVVSSRVVQEYLINFAKPLIYSTALPPHGLAAIEAAYELLPELDPARTLLDRRVRFFRSLAAAHHLPVSESESPIQALIVPNPVSVQTLAQKAQAEGFDVRPIFSPTVPRGQERIRICLHSYNSENEIRELVLVLKKGLEGLRR